MSAALGLREWQHIQVDMTSPEGGNIRLEPKASKDRAAIGTGLEKWTAYGEKGRKPKMNTNTVTE